MLTEADYVKQQQSLGRRIHEHDGVFWEEVYPFYCKPAFVYRAFDPGTARPARWRSLLGYSHQVCARERGNRTVPFMVLERERLDDFGLMKLPTKKRNQVRRALEHCAIQPITDLELVLERLREINLSQAVRQEQGAGAEAPARRYTEEAEAWRAQIRREFALEEREWWGAFVDGALVAYLRTYQVDGIRIIQQTKADTAYFKFHPVDALYYEVLSRAATDATCQRIVNGDPRHESLNHFKEQFLFRAVEYPYYSSNAWLVNAAKRLVLGRDRQSRSVLADKLTIRPGTAGTEE
ncbi:MAG: hypothetical protein RKO24_00890 [Candidatus Competibacter sp.]|nr:hypothetical protein [Candidatus Competibacter sp.]